MITPAYRYRATLNRVIDGDTYVLDVDLGFRITAAITVRVRGVDTPEVVGATKAAGLAAAGYAAALLAGAPIVIESYKDKQSFARWVADVYVDGVSIATALIAGGYGVRI